MNVDDGVVLAMIQITDDRVPNGGTSAFNTRIVQRYLLLLDPARGKERLMEIQQHDGVVVDVAGLGRASPSFCETERYLWAHSVMHHHNELYR